MSWKIRNLKRQALAVSHSENVSGWVKALADKQRDEPQRLVDIQQQLKMPMVEVWIRGFARWLSLSSEGAFTKRRKVWVSRYR